jgi:hypothetical protein
MYQSKIPPYPTFYKVTVCTPTFFLVARVAFTPLKVFISPPFDKRGIGGFKKSTNRNKLLTFGIISFECLKSDSLLEIGIDCAHQSS